MATAYTRCPKCGHTPLPLDQGLPAACPACGVVLAKVGQAMRRRSRQQAAAEEEENGTPAWTDVLQHVPERVDALRFWLRIALLAGFAVWGLVLVRMDYRIGEIGQSFVHRPLLMFHEAGHVIFMAFGEWMMILGGTLGQLLMPLLLAGALLLKNRDPFGAAIGLWFFGVSVLDVAPYMYDALDPQLVLLSGRTGEEGGHDWIYLFESMGLLQRAQAIGGTTHTLGAVLVFVSLAWAAWILRLQYARIAGDVLREE